MRHGAPSWGASKKKSRVIWHAEVPEAVRQKPAFDEQDRTALAESVPKEVPERQVEAAIAACDLSVQDWEKK